MNLEGILNSLHRVGLSSSEEEIVVITDEPKIAGFLCFPKEEVLKHYEAKEVFGQGFDPNRTKARIKAVGEFLERLCLNNPDEEKFIISKYKPNRNFVEPALFCCYSEEQLSDKQIFLEESRKAEYRWWPVINLTSGKKCLIPAQLIFLSSNLADEFPIRRERISTGAALGPKGTFHALTSGLMESVERDACVYSYLTRRHINKIIDLPKGITNLVDYLKRYQLETHIFDVTTDLQIPTVLVITLDYTGIGPAVNVGSRADINCDNAIKYAILESIHCRRVSRVLRKLQFPEQLPKEYEVTSMDNRFYYWHSSERIQDLDFWLNSSGTVSYRDLKRNNTNLEKSIRTLKSKGYHIFVADMTIAPIRNGGFEALKIVIPELHPLYLDERAKALYSVHYGVIKDNKTLKPHPLT